MAKFWKFISLSWVLLVAGSSFAQETVTLFQGNNRLVWTVLDSGSTVTQDFIWAGAASERGTVRFGYNGFCSIVSWTDTTTTASQVVASYDSLKKVVYPLFYDASSGQFEIGTAGLFTVNVDSFLVANWIDWGTSHSDNTYTKASTINALNCDGLRVVTTAKSDMIFRDEVKWTEGVQ